jgi:DNA-binding NarL/FixJ family response regulator
MEFRQSGDVAARRVAVASNLRLVAEAVTAALAGRGCSTMKVGWPHPDPADRAVTQLERIRPNVVLLICEFDLSSSVTEAQALVRAYDAPWLVMSGDRPGPLWGAMIEAGAEAVVPTTTALDRILELIEALAREEAVMGVVEREALVRQWHALRADQEALLARIRLLTPRERAVLGMLYDGFSVTAIAEHFQVSPTTVRSQVRAVLRKLGVNSQLAAVGVLDALLDGERNLA